MQMSARVERPIATWGRTRFPVAAEVEAVNHHQAGAQRRRALADLWRSTEPPTVRLRPESLTAADSLEQDIGRWPRGRVAAGNLRVQLRRSSSSRRHKRVSVRTSPPRQELVVLHAAGGARPGSVGADRPGVRPAPAPAARGRPGQRAANRAQPPSSAGRNTSMACGGRCTSPGRRPPARGGRRRRGRRSAPTRVGAALTSPVVLGHAAVADLDRGRRQRGHLRRGRRHRPGLAGAARNRQRQQRGEGRAADMRGRRVDMNRKGSPVQAVVARLPATR